MLKNEPGRFGLAVLLFAILGTSPLLSAPILIPKGIPESEPAEPIVNPRLPGSPLRSGLPLDFTHFASRSHPQDDEETARKRVLESIGMDESGAESPVPGGQLQQESIAKVDPVRRPALYTSRSDILAEEQVPPFWFDDLSSSRPVLQDVLQSVGRIEVHNLERDLGLRSHALGCALGTGFVIAPRIVITNRHVAEKFIDPNTLEMLSSRYDGRKAVVFINFAATVDNARPVSVEIDRALYIAPMTGPDVALLSIKESDESPPPPVPVSFLPYSDQELQTSRKVVVCGHPVADDYSADYFFRVLGVKRISPGNLVGAFRRNDHVILGHDCSTTNGSSGSAVIDLQRRAVVGVHYLGSQGVNEAELLSEVAKSQQVREILGLDRMPQNTAPVKPGAVIEIPRPVLATCEGRIVGTVQENWEATLRSRATEISKVLPSVGLLSIEGHPTIKEVGTAFVVAPGRIVTANFAAGVFADLDSDGKPHFRVDGDGNPMKVFINFKWDHCSLGSPQMVSEILFLGDTSGNGSGIAVLKFEGESPSSLVLDTGSAATGRDVYVVGYPFHDFRSPLNVTSFLFRGVYGQKSLAPGKIIALDAPGKILALDANDRPDDPGRFVYHDCTTSGGCGGAPVIDMESGHVVGVHHSGIFLQWNRAVSSKSLLESEAIRKALGL